MIVTRLPRFRPAQYRFNFVINWHIPNFFTVILQEVKTKGMHGLKSLFLLLWAWAGFQFSTMAQNMDQTVYQFTLQDIYGNDVSLEQFKGKVLIIVNVASECGYTPQYADLQSMYEEYKDKGLVVLGFPSNEFGEQEPGTNAEIQTFCSTKFGVDFPMFSKITVEGEDQHALYKFLTHKDLNGAVDAKVKWNFQKFLISREGKVLESIKPSLTIADPAVRTTIEAALN
jgi:glutathione peroxidase